MSVGLTARESAQGLAAPPRSERTAECSPTASVAKVRPVTYMLLSGGPLPRVKVTHDL